jgi:CRP-like cAMP-binding protein
MAAVDTRAAEALRRIQVLEALSDAQIATLAAIVSRVEYRPEHQLYSEGEDGADFMFVGAGEVEARRRTPFGDQRVATLGVGDLVGEVSLLDGKPRSSSVVAVSEGFMWRFDATGVAAAAAGDPALELALLRMFCRSLAGKIRQANQVMTQIMAPGETAAPTGARGSTGAAGDVDQDTRRRLLEEQGVAAEEIKRLATWATAQRFAAGETIFAEGDPGDALYIVAEGQVRISRRIPGLGEEALAILEGGEVFGEMALIDRSPRSADAIAHTGGSTVLVVSREQLDGAVTSRTAAHAQFLRTLCQVLCRRLRNMNDQLVAYRTIAWF